MTPCGFPPTPDDGTVHGLGLRPGSRIVLTEVEGHLEISPATTPVRLVDNEGALVAVADIDLPVLTAEQVRDAVEATRR